MRRAKQRRQTFRCFAGGSCAGSHLLKFVTKSGLNPKILISDFPRSSEGPAGKPKAPFLKIDSAFFGYFGMVQSTSRSFLPEPRFLNRSGSEMRLLLIPWPKVFLKSSNSTN